MIRSAPASTLYGPNPTTAPVAPAAYGDLMGPNAQATQPLNHTLQPIVTGTSVIGIKFKGGVMLGADTLCSYGSLSRFKEIPRLHKVGKSTLIGFGGDYSDTQEILNKLENLSIEDENYDDGAFLKAPEIHSYLTRILYNRRCKFDPLWNFSLVAGCDDNKEFLGYNDLVGSSYKDNYAATGFGTYLAMPLLRGGYTENLSEAEAKKILEAALKVLFYRDCRSLNRIQIGVVDKDGVRITEPYTIEGDWAVGSYVKGYGTCNNP
eukprot:GFYU01000980.1.p1 GENE.GFYU01000980.1~~GFYU01000980.1.p1  ORF type:complete len:278 (-),score=76.00 GFYU01000980.1:303-1094(-)